MNTAQNSSAGKHTPGLRIPMQVPLVTLFLSWPCQWQGKWMLNISPIAVAEMGGPWDSEQDAVAAVLATGQWEQLKDRTSPHFVPSQPRDLSAAALRCQ